MSYSVSSVVSTPRILKHMSDNASSTGSAATNSQSTMQTNGAPQAAPRQPDEPLKVDPAWAEIIQRCESIVEDFRRGNATKIRAIHLLADELRKGPLAGNKEPFQQEQALQVYYNMLTEHEQDNTDAQQ